MYFANPSTPQVRDVMTAGLLCGIEAPGGGPLVPAGVTWCADNGSFGKGYPGDPAFLRWLDARRHRPLCRFAVVPDVVGDAAATLERFRVLAPAVRAMGYPVALAGQNGLENLTVPWDAFDVMFLGGCLECAPCGFVPPSDCDLDRCPHCHARLREWKLGRAAADFVTEASARGKWVHMGRVNSMQRLRYAARIGCDSADGTYLTFGPDENLPKLLRWLRDVNNVNGQQELWPAAGWS